MGFSAVKLRFHSADWRDDLKVIEACRKAVGDTMDILVDANQGFHFNIFPGTPPQWDVPTAVAVARALEEYDVFWLEEPLDRNNYAGLRELREQTSMRIAGGEIMWRLHEYALLVERRCLDVLQTDAMFFGGIAMCRKVAALAEANHLGFAPHIWNNGFALLANLHLIAASPACRFCEFPYEPPSWTPAARDALFAEPVEIEADRYVRVLSPASTATSVVPTIWSPSPVVAGSSAPRAPPSERQSSVRCSRRRSSKRLATRSGSSPSPSCSGRTFFTTETS